MDGVHSLAMLRGIKIISKKGTHICEYRSHGFVRHLDGRSELRCHMLVVISPIKIEQAYLCCESHESSRRVCRMSSLLIIIQSARQNALVDAVGGSFHGSKINVTRRRHDSAATVS